VLQYINNNKMAKTEKILERIEELKSQTGVPRTLFAVCPNSMSVIKASFRAAKRNNAPIKFAATLNQIDSDKGYVGITQGEFTKMLADEARSVNFNGPYIVAMDHGGPWLKDKQSQERWDLERAMEGVKKSFEDAIKAGYDLIHVDPTVDIFVPAGEIIDIKVVAQRTVELIRHSEKFRRKHNYPAISYEVGTEEVHGGLADENTFDTFIELLKSGLEQEGFPDVWPCFIVGKVGTDLHTTTFNKEVAASLTKKVRKFGSYIKGHYTDGVTTPEALVARYRLYENLNRNGVDTSMLIKSDKHSSGATICLNYYEDRANITYQGAMDFMSLDNIDTTVFTTTKHIHLSSIFMQSGIKRNLIDILKLARDNNVTTSLDPQWDPYEKWDMDYEKILPYVDVFLPNETELKLITRSITLEEAVGKISPYIQMCVVKLGRKGSLLLQKNWQSKHLDAFLNNTVIDAIGAGDSFNAGFIHAFVKGETVENAQVAGNLTGAINTTGTGGTGAFTSKEAVKNIAWERFNQLLKI
jgi:sugar/nucleoside kinase (ribokinase family)